MSIMPERTPSQTIGPYLHIVLTPADYQFREVFSANVADPGIPGTHIRIEGRIFDGEGNVAPDAMVEIWQADHQGRYAHPADGRPLASNSFRGFGRCATGKDGGFAFATIKPGTVPGPDGTTQAPHINVGIFSRGLLKRLFTRIYFAGDAANTSDPILALVPADRRDTLVAKPDPAKPGLYRFDIRLQGADETVFFDA
jgi:protocatechuate 3,4-dioxygenase alpha subunit